jgi:hypothetical protein
MEAAYDHNLYKDCKKIGLYAKENNWRLMDGRLLGEKLLYKLFYQKGVLNQGTKEPYQIFNKYFLITYKHAPNGILNRVVLITPEGQEYFKKRIPQWLAEGWTYTIGKGKRR